MEGEERVRRLDDEGEDEKRRMPPPPSSHRGRTPRVEVRGVALYTPLQHLHALFERVGAVKQVEVQRDEATRLRTGAFLVEFYDSSHCEVALRHLNGFCLDDRPLDIRREGAAREGARYGARKRRHDDHRDMNR